MSSASERMTFWRNWYDGAKSLPDEQRLEWYDAILDFAFAGTMPKPGDGIKYLAVKMTKGSIETSRNRQQSGRKGGKARSRAEAKRKQNASKAEADPNHIDIDVDVDRDVDTKTTSSRAKTPTLKQFLAGAITTGVPADFATSLHAELESAGWADGKGLPIGNWRRYLKTAWNDEQKKIGARAVEVERDRLIDYDGVI